LRNKYRESDHRIVKEVEHEIFMRQRPKAVQYLSSKDALSYADFLAVHAILFEEFYPWAGQDRATTLPNSAVKKGEVLFSHPQASRLAVEHGLRLGQDAVTMSQKPGEVMGLFAYGHPFLDGNGRTMLLVHMELCHRAGFSIAWQKSDKVQYLSALNVKEYKKYSKVSLSHKGYRPF
jgi:cell filamentation protein